MDERSSQKIKQLQEAMGIMQHHDAITGTAKQFVSDDYTHWLDKTIMVAEEAIVDAYDRLWMKEGFTPTSSLTFCNLLNASRCDATQNLSQHSDVVLIIYNPVAHPVKHYVRLPIRGIAGYRVRDHLGTTTTSQVS